MRCIVTLVAIKWMVMLWTVFWWIIPVCVHWTLLDLLNLQSCSQDSSIYHSLTKIRQLTIYLQVQLYQLCRSKSCITINYPYSNVCLYGKISTCDLAVLSETRWRSNSIPWCISFSLILSLRTWLNHVLHAALVVKSCHAFHTCMDSVASAFKSTS